MKKSDIIMVLGASGLVGSALIRNLKKDKYENIIEIYHKDYDLRNINDVNKLFIKYKPNFLFLAAAKVGGVMANKTYPAEFIYDNIMIGSNIIDFCYKYKIKKLLNLGSSCIYPKFAEQPINERSLLTGLLEETNEAYAIAKISAIKMCKFYNEQYGTNFISVMPTNLYGPNDNYDPESSHVIPAMISKFTNAQINNEENVTLWGTGNPKREYLYSEDLADACIDLMKNYDYNDIGEFINIGSSQEYTIKETAEIIKNKVGYKGNIIWDTSKPDGTPRKILDSSRINKLGWFAKTTFEKGLENVIDEYKKGLK